MRAYGQYCPISRAAEVLGDRWNLLIVREMVCGANRFNALARGLPGMSRALLSKRLRQLEAAGIIRRDDGLYALTEAGAELAPLLSGLGEWGAKWAFDDPSPEELDPELLMWWMHTRLDTTKLPEKRTILEFAFSDDRRRFWLVVEPAEVSICLSDPGFGVDVLVQSDLRTMYKVWLGREELGNALIDGRIELDGIPALTRQFPSWLELSPVASIVRRATTAV